ncbi:PPC domain-containing protein [Streptomyces sp. NE06-03E]|uniref:PPC domain-containing protein n=1 Tax=unclassified Streptomyces TaxID=2593676 RepID=UPI0029A69576|nr:PPC domain-containing protein [Streptomyces sp. NE06-03E]MDX3054328.1 PPC domain-containing protein [Streptomyces sp. NE06-03E]
MEDTVRKILLPSAIGVVMMSATLTPAAAAGPTVHSSTSLRTGKPQEQISTPTDAVDAQRCRDASPVRTTLAAGRRSRGTHVTGTLPSAVRFFTLPTGAEDNGSLAKATETGIGEGRRLGVHVTGTVGDGPHGQEGTGTGDFDFYRLRARAGQTITAKITTSSMDSALTLYDATGHALARADDSAGTLNPTLISRVPRSGTYHLMVAGSGSAPADPSDSGSGGGAPGENGAYTLSLSATLVRTQHYALHLRAGDVIGAAVDGSPDKVAVYGPDGTEDEGSTGNVAHNHPASSPLPSGKISLDDVAATDGWYCIAVSGDTRGSYRLKTLVTRPHLEGRGQEQTIFLDYDGARIDPSVFASSGLPVTPGLRTTSPLSAFLDAWGLPAGAKEPLADAITANVRQKLQTDLEDSGINQRLGVRILDSVHDPDPGVAKDVDRVVIGGTIEETDLPTLGVTSSIDPGNFDASDTSIVMLDLLSGPAEDSISLNHYLTPSSDRITFISTVVANLVSHELGHALGNWHTAADGTSTLMDNDDTFLSMGADGVGGTADDDAPQTFGTDTFTDADGLTGMQDAAVRTAYALSR